MNDLTLFDTPRGRARTTDPDTSRTAADSISRSAEDAIKRLFRIPRALTADQVADMLPEFKRETLKSALSRVVRDGHVEDSGSRAPSRYGRPSIVWKRTERVES